MANATTTAPATRQVLSAQHTAADVRKFLDNGQTDLDSVVTWATDTRLEAPEVYMTFGKVFDEATMSAVISAQTAMAVAMAVATAVAAVKQSSGGGTITWKVSKRGLISVYGLNARYPVSLYLPQLRRYAAAVLGVEGPAFDKSPVGKWVASHPVGTFATDDYESESDKVWLQDARNGKHVHVVVRGDAVAVSLSLAAAE